MAISTTTSQRELERVAQLCYEGKYVRVSLASLASQGYNAESTTSNWDSIKLSGNGYADYIALIEAGAYDNGDARYETPEITAQFSASSGGSGLIYNTVYVVVGEPLAFDITNAALTDNVATITTDGAHGFTTGRTAIITGATNSVFDGTYTIASTPASDTFTFAKTNMNISSAASTGTATQITYNGYPHSIITESPGVILAPSQSVSYRIQFCTDD